eukprot:3431818-Pleurochrysis_carterae.AAC.3
MQLPGSDASRTGCQHTHVLLPPPFETDAKRRASFVAKHEDRHSTGASPAQQKPEKPKDPFPNHVVDAKMGAMAVKAIKRPADNPEVSPIKRMRDSS